MSLLSRQSANAAESMLTETLTGLQGSAQLGRLFRLVLILQSERFLNARELAERCEVSRRTIYRDLEVISSAGLPVRYRADRQGYQLARGPFLSPTSIEEKEALALLILASTWRKGVNLGLSASAWDGAVKVVQGLAPEIRERVLAAAETFPQDEPKPDLNPDRRQVHELIRRALAERKQVRLWYGQMGVVGEENCTKFSPYCLLHRDNQWFLVGRSTLHRRIEVIGVSWVRKAVLTEDDYTIPPRFRLDRVFGHAWGVVREPVHHRVRLRFSARVAPELNDTTWHPTQKRTLLDDGRVDLEFSLDGVGEVRRWILGFGDEVEVLEPPLLRRQVFQVAARIARLHRPARKLRLPPEVGG